LAAKGVASHVRRAAPGWERRSAHPPAGRAGVAAVA
jgi:hypothetical protein